APKYAFSAEQNVILIVLDAFQSDVFDDIIKQEPKYASRLVGFTYFPDAVAGANFTEIAVPALLTGQIYDNGRPRQDFMREAFLKTGITTLLNSQGFVADIYPWLGW